jgi:four helix bundle protein
MRSDRVRFDFERLDVFTVALDAVVIVDRLAEDLPEGRGYMRDQLRRAANSIPLNIAEGAGEFMAAEKARFYRIAKRSATECAGQILVCRKHGMFTAPQIESALDVLERVIAMLVTLVRRCGDRDRARIDGQDAA